MDKGEDRFHYHYSRVERLKLKRAQEAPLSKAKASLLAKIAGPNKSVRSFVIIYILFAVLAWGLFSIYRDYKGSKDERLYTISGGHKIAVRLVDRKERKGLNILIHNKSRVDWKVDTLKLDWGGQLKATNIGLTLKPGDFEAVFVSVILTNQALKDLILTVDE